MDNIKQLEREAELLKQILELKEKIKALESYEVVRYVPYYPYPIYPDTARPFYPEYPNITLCGGTTGQMNESCLTN